MRTFNSLSKKERIKKNQDFQSIFNQGKRYSNEKITICFAFRAAESEIQASRRLGIVVSRKVGTACQRNYLKRIIREAFRKNKGLFRESLDLIVILKPAARTVSGQSLTTGFLELCKKAHLQI